MTTAVHMTKKNPDCYHFYCFDSCSSSYFDFQIAIDSMVSRMKIAKAIQMEEDVDQKALIEAY